MVKLRIIFKKRNQLDGESALVRCRNEIGEEEEANKQRTIVQKWKQIDGDRTTEIDEGRAIAKCRNEMDDEEEEKGRAIVKKRKQLDGERAFEINGIVKCRNAIDEEEEHTVRAVKKRKQLDGERAIEFNGIVKCRNAIDEEEEEHTVRSVKKRKQIDGEKAIEIDEEEEEKERAIDKATVKFRNETDEEEKKERSVTKRTQIDGERAIVKCRYEIDHEEEQKERAIMKKRKHIDGDRAIVIRGNEIGDEKKEQNMKERVIVKLGNSFDAIELNYKERLVGERISDDHSLPSPCKDLPEDLIERILMRLPAQDLINCSCMSKLWYNTVFNDPHFAASHFVHNQNKLSLFFDLYNICVDNTKKAFYLRVVEMDNVVIGDVECMTAVNLPGTIETVGQCNGLTCIRKVKSRRHISGTLMVINPIRGEIFGLHYATPTGCIYLCSGFGFDPLSQEYKAVVIFTSDTKGGEFVSMVFTLGTDHSWRKITTAMSPPPGSPPFPSGMVTIVSRRPHTLCGADLYWRVTNKVHSNARTEMLLLFDLHGEKIQFIQFPTECALTPRSATTTTMNAQHQYLAVDHLLEFKGYPCIARSEKIMMSNIDHSGHRCVDQGSSCCCCCKVHLYILKDKAKQVWIKGETFDVQIEDQEGLLPGPFCCLFGTTTTVTTPRTRVLTISDQVILSWFDGNRLLFYNLQKKELDVVIVSRSRSGFFQTKTNPKGFCISDDNVYPGDMDYQLHAHVENMVSLKTFIPRGAETRKYNCLDDWECAIDKNPQTGYVRMGRNSVNIYTFG